MSINNNIISNKINELKSIELEFKKLEQDKQKLITSFGAKPIETLKKKPPFKSFYNGLLTSHRDFDKFYSRLASNEKSAIVSGLNASGSFHLGHVGIFDTTLFFQKKYNLEVFAPISDDESYVARKISNQKEGMHNALKLVRQYLAYGFDPNKTHFIIDQIYTNIYNIAIKLSRGINITTIRAIYNYKDSDNIGLIFYPSVQSAHILFPHTKGIKNILVPIGLDEDTHIRACRDVAEKYGYGKVGVLHSRFLPGIDGKKMSKSKGNAIYLFDDDEKVIKQKIFKAFSGGRATIQEHRDLGGIPEIDIAYTYLKYLFYNDKQDKELYNDYKKGNLLSGEIKKLLLDEVLSKVQKFKDNYNKITIKDLSTAIMKNEDVDIENLINEFNILSDEK